MHLLRKTIKDLCDFVKEKDIITFPNLPCSCGMFMEFMPSPCYVESYGMNMIHDMYLESKTVDPDVPRIVNSSFLWLTKDLASRKF
jgi:hypothetical protein